MKKAKRKFILIIFLAILIIAATITFYFLLIFSRPSLYKNNKYRFQFGYDKHSRINELTTKDSRLLIDLTNEELVKDGKRDDVKFFSLEVSNLSCQEWMRGLSPSSSRAIGGIMGRYWEGSGAYGIYRRMACITKDNYSFAFVNDTTYEQNKNKTGSLFGQVLSSFKFF